MSRLWLLLLDAVTLLLLAYFTVSYAYAAPGRWLRADGTWEDAPCPPEAAQADAGSVVRLPVGCLVLSPRVGYTVAQDERARTELARLRLAESDLKLEIGRSRGAADKIFADYQAQVGQLTSDLGQERDARVKAESERDVALASASAAEEGRWHVGVLGGVVGLLLGGMVGVVVAVSALH